MAELDVRLTAAEAETWSTYTSSEWAPFRAAWHARGLRRAPTGAADDPRSQRGVLYPIVKARPHDVGRWVSEAPVPVSFVIVGFVLAQWDLVRASVPDDRGALMPKDANR